MRIVCECGTRSCLNQITVRPDEYAPVWDDPTLFITKPGHDFPETETVVSKTDGWARAPRICGQSSSRSSTSARRATLTAGHNRWARAPHSLGVDRAEPLWDPPGLPGREYVPAYDRCVEERFERQARNESLLRSVNEQIAALSHGAAGWADPAHQFSFTCECGKLEGCGGRVLMTVAEYELVHSQRDRFAVLPGHQTEEIEYVVKQDERSVVVDKRDVYEHDVE